MGIIAAPAKHRNTAIPFNMADLAQFAAATTNLSSLVMQFSTMIARHGFTGHFCMKKSDNTGFTPLFGDASSLNTDNFLAESENIFPVQSWQNNDLYIGIFGHDVPINPQLRIRLIGWAEVYATYAIALLERDADVQTGTGLGVVQRQCLALILIGWKESAIAEALEISPLAVRGHIEHAQILLGVSSRIEAVSIAARRGWLANLGQVKPINFEWQQNIIVN